MARIKDIYECRDKIIKTLQYKGASKETAEDICHNAILKCIECIDDINKNLCGWLMTTALNIWFDDLKKRKQDQEKIENFIRFFTQEELNDHKMIEQEIFDECIEELEKCNFSQYQIIKERMQGMSYKKIADKLFPRRNPKVESIKKAAQRGRDFLKQCTQNKLKENGI